MCGICGIIGLNKAPIYEQELKAMLDLQRHRGPDDEGTFLEDSIGLGFVRLSILDLSQLGNQPMVSEDGNFVMVYNGEVYNYLELRDELIGRGYVFKSNTDTEVVLAAYSAWGDNCLNKLNGMFAFAVYDRKKRQLTIARDRFGIKPLYYTQIGERVAFASEIPPLLSLMPRGTVSVNQQSMFDYLVHERVDHTEETFFQNILKLPQGSVMKFVDGRVSKFRWYKLNEKINKRRIGPEEYREVLQSSIGFTLRSDVPIGVPLSGGLDSSTIVSMLFNQFKMKDLHTFSAVYGKGLPGDESRYIEEFSPHLKNMYYIQPTGETLFNDLDDFVSTHQEPVTRTGPYAQYKVMELASERVKVTLDGQGADEILAGYKSLFGFYYFELLRQKKFAKLAKELWHVCGNSGGMGAMISGIYYALPHQLKQNIMRSQRGVVSQEFYDQYANTSRVTELLMSAKNLNSSLLSMVENKLEHLLKWSDRNSMRFSVESRVPFLDHRLVELTLSLPSDQIINNGYSKYILREAMSGLLAESIRSRRDKIGFGTPENTWLRTPVFRDLIETILTSDFFRQHPYIDIHRATKAYKMHLNGQKNIARQIWKWINIYLWHHQFIRGHCPLPNHRNRL